MLDTDGFNLRIVSALPFLDTTGYDLVLISILTLGALLSVSFILSLMHFE